MSGNIITGVIIGIVLIVITLMLIFLLKTGKKQTSVVQPDQAGKPFDLTAIEGIGPKIVALLKKKGIDSYQALAMMETAKLEAILKQAGLAMADPATWPKQAELLADGKMKELEELQHQLKGGRLE